MVGTITYRVRQAERKGSGRVLWDSLAQDGPVFNLDTLHTADRSSATVHLEDGTEIELGEDSLLVPDVSDEASRLGLSGGSMRIRSGASGAPLEVSSAAGKLSLDKGAAASVADRGGSLAVAVSSGRASLASSGAGPATAVEGGQALAIGPGGSVSEVPLEPVAPADGSELVAPAGALSAEFSWIAPAAFHGRLVLAADPSFAKLAQASEVSGLGAKLELKPGSYYWRIESGSSRSRAMRLEVLASAAPIVVKPEPSEVIECVGNSQPLVDLAWTNSPHAVSYIVEIDRDGSFAKPLVKQVLSRNSMSTDGLGPGDWHCRVTPIYPAGKIGSASAPAIFELAAAEAPRPEWRDSASEAVEVSTAAAKEGALRLAWKSVEGADSYHVEIARDKDLSEVVAETRSTGSSTSMAAELAEGRYYVGVRASVKGKEGPPSEPRVLVVVKPYAIRLLTPEPGSDLDPERRDLGFTWRDPNGLGRYKLELSSDPDFSSLAGTAESSTPRASIRVSDETAGELYWRVSALGSKGGSGAVSETASFRLPALLPSPLAISPAEGETIDAFLRSGFAFAWRPSAGATEYRLVLLRATAGALIEVRDWTVQSSSVAVDDMSFLAPDAYAWRLTAVARRGEDVVGRSSTATRYFRIIQSTQVEAAEGIELSSAGGASLLPPDFHPPGTIYVH